ncbi:MAG: hypothetical protein K0S12_1500, partial [Bacteroidetes bacterium]|nr:hypothetical protein [Bacteroidota bacterium]
MAIALRRLLRTGTVSRRKGASYKRNNNPQSRLTEKKVRAEIS